MRESGGKTAARGARAGTALAERAAGRCGAAARSSFPTSRCSRRLDASRRWFLEIAGFWTPNYVARKLARYREARLSNLILCIDDERNCTEGDLPAGALVLRFRRRVDPAAVLQLIDGKGHQ